MTFLDFLSIISCGVLSWFGTRLALSAASAVQKEGGVYERLADADKAFWYIAAILPRIFVGPLMILTSGFIAGVCFAS